MSRRRYFEAEERVHGAGSSLYEVSGRHPKGDPARHRAEVGQRVQIVAKSGVITMVPDQPIGRMKGFLKGMKSRALREKKDRQ